MELLGIVLGLGNPGATYHRTRHNLGFRVVDRLAQVGSAELSVDSDIGRRAWTAEATIEGGRYILAKPRTFMNRSGLAGADLCRHHDVPAERLLVVYDDADLALGRIRVRRGGGDGGHNGVRSLIEHLGTPAFARIRLGVRGEGREDVSLADYVLDTFAPEEEEIAGALVELGAEAAASILVGGVTAAMNAFNGRNVGPSVDREED